jgi:diguanylate cyclase (GGDEF)-like protein
VPADRAKVATIAGASKLHQLHFLTETQRLLNAGSSDADRAITVVLERAMAVTGARGAAVEIAEGDTMVVRAATGVLDTGHGGRAAGGETLSDLALRMGMSLNCRDSETDARVDDKEACRQVGARSLLVVPILSGGHGLGVLKLVSDQVDRFDQTDGDVVELMAGFVATSLSVGSPLEHEAHRALQDPLTGLPNRMILMDRLQQAIYDARRYHRPFGLFVIEPEGIEGVSSALGRDATDAVLRAVATGLSATVRSGDTLARSDDDQFVILCINAERSVVEERIRNRVDTVLASVSKEIGLDDVALRGHLGVVWSAGNEASAESLLTTASTAAYRARRQSLVGR